MRFGYIFLIFVVDQHLINQKNLKEINFTYL